MRRNPTRKAKPPTLAEAGLPSTWFHGTQKTFGKLKAQGGACVWLADKAGAMAYATPHYGRRSAIRLIEVVLAPDTRVVDLADARDPVVREFVRLDTSASNMRWHGREDVTDAEMADALAYWKNRKTHYDAIEARSWAKAFFRKAGADALLVRDVAGWGGHEEMPSLCLLNPKKVVSERDVAPNLSLVRPENMPKRANPRRNPSPVAAFLRAYEDISRPLGRDGYRRTLGEDVVLSLAEAEDGTVSLDSIESLSARKGAGRAALEQVASLADKYGVTLKLHPEPFGERAMSRSRLVQFYEGLGFTFSPYDDPDDDFSEMVRVPRRRNPTVRLRGFGTKRAVSPGVEAFLRAFFDSSYPSPLSSEPTERVLSGLDVLVEVTPQHGGVHIDEVRALVPQQGAGTKAMRFLTDLADKHGITLMLYPMPFGSAAMSRDDLVRFYRRHGFRWVDEEEDGEEDEMVRTPRRPNPPLRRNRSPSSTSRRKPSYSESELARLEEASARANEAKAAAWEKVLAVVRERVMRQLDKVAPGEVHPKWAVTEYTQDYMRGPFLQDRLNMPEYMDWQITSEKARLAERVAEDYRIGLYAQTRLQSIKRARAGDKNLAGADLSRASLRGVDLADADLKDAWLVDTTLTGANLAGADLRGTKFSSTRLHGANLNGANLEGANLSGTNLSGTNFAGANLARSNLASADLSGANLAGADLSESSLSSARLKGSDLTAANLKGADLRHAILTDARLKGATLDDVRYNSRTRWPEELTQPPEEHLPVPDRRSSDAFRRWFGKSAVVDRWGRPLVVYHGTLSGGFDAFSPAMIEEEQHGFYFTSDLRLARDYSYQRWGRVPDPVTGSGTQGVYRVYLKMERPFVFDAKGARARQLYVPRFPDASTTYEVVEAVKATGKYDGVIFRNLLDPAPLDTGRVDSADVYVVFEPTQIKSATANVGTFDPADPRITHNPRRRPNPPLRRNSDHGPYEAGKKYHGFIPEVRYLPVSVIYRAEIDFKPEVLTVSDRVAERMDFSDPVDVTAHRFPSAGWASVYPPRMRRPADEDDDTAPEVILRDGHHRLAAAVQTGRAWLPVSLHAVNAKGEKLNALVRLSRDIEASRR